MIIDHRENDEYLELLRRDEIPLGLGLGIDLDRNLRFKRGAFNVILGHANVGKTYWVLFYLLAHSYINNLKHLIYSSENTVNGIKRNLIELYQGKKIKEMTKEELEDSKLFIESHFDFIDTTKKLFEISDFMKGVQAMGDYDSLMIDPHNSFQRPRGVNSHEYDYEVASKLRLFAKKTNTTIYLCTHATSEALRKTHKGKGKDEHPYEGMPIPPNSADAEGGGKWVNRADDFIVIHRYVQSATDWMFTEVHVRKVKEVESGGKPTYLDQPVRFKLHKGTQFLNNGINCLENKEISNTLVPNIGFDETEEPPF